MRKSGNRILLLLRQVRLDEWSHRRQVVGEAHRAAFLAGVDLLDLPCERQEPGELVAQRRVVPLQDVLDELWQGSVEPADAAISGQAEGCLVRPDGLEHLGGVQSAAGTGLGQGLLPSAAVIEPVPVEDLGGGGNRHRQLAQRLLCPDHVQSSSGPERPRRCFRRFGYFLGASGMSTASMTCTMPFDARMEASTFAPLTVTFPVLHPDGDLAAADLAELLAVLEPLHLVDRRRHVVLEELLQLALLLGLEQLLHRALGQLVERGVGGREDGERAGVLQRGRVVRGLERGHQRGVVLRGRGDVHDVLHVPLGMRGQGDERGGEKDALHGSSGEWGSASLQLSATPKVPSSGPGCVRGGP